MKKYKPEKSNGRTQPMLVGDMIEGLIQASNACSVMVHHLQDPRFMDIRSTLDLTVGMARTLATTSLRYGTPDVKTVVGYRKPTSSTPSIIPTSETPSTPTKVIV